MTKVETIIDRIEKFAPLSIAMTNDPTGFQLGRRDQEVKKCLVTLDVRPEVVDEAIKIGAQMIFSHHPLVFHSIRQLDLADPQNAMYAQLFKHDISVYSAHTNADKATGGMDDWLSERLGLMDVQGLFKDEDGVFLGRKGKLPQTLKPVAFAEYVKQKLQLQGVKLITSSHDRPIQTVGLVGGDGNKFYIEAVKAGLDAYITGDVYYHTAHDMKAYGLTVVDAGHYIESIFKFKMTENLVKWGQEENWSVSFVPSKISTDPFEFI